MPRPQLPPPHQHRIQLWGDCVQVALRLCGGQSRSSPAPAKLAIEALTRNISAEMGAALIRVNCIHPGLIDTPMIEWVLKHPDPSVLAGVLGQISLGRPGQPREIGTVAAFFASDEARHVTGQSMFVDGGWVGK